MLTHIFFSAKNMHSQDFLLYDSAIKSFRVFFFLRLQYYIDRNKSELPAILQLNFQPGYSALKLHSHCRLKIPIRSFYLPSYVPESGFCGNNQSNETYKFLSTFSGKLIYSEINVQPSYPPIIQLFSETLFSLPFSLRVPRLSPPFNNSSHRFDLTSLV